MSASTKDLLALSEGILAQAPPVKEAAGRVNPIVDDGLKDVVVPNAFVDQVVGFSNALDEATDPDKKQEMMPKFEPITEATILKERLESLVENLKSLLKEARNVMEEITLTGSFGPNFAPVEKKKKKNGSCKDNQRNQS